MKRFFRKRNAEAGLSMLQTIVIGGAIAMVAAGSGALFLREMRQRKIEHLKISQKAVSEKVFHYMTSTDGLRLTADRIWDILNWQGPYGQATRAFKNCLATSGNPDCTENSENAWVSHLSILNPLHETVHPVSRSPDGYQYWAVDGTPCTSAVAASKQCPIASRVSFRAVCGGTNDSLFVCDQATYFLFRYEVTNPVSIFTGNTSGYRVRDIQGTVTLTSEEINYVTPPSNPTCNTAQGYVPTGITALGNFTCGRPPANTRLIARHYIVGNRPSPNCTFKNVARPDGSLYDVSFKNLESTLPAKATLPYFLNGSPMTARRSFAGLWGTFEFGTRIDIGGHGSCVNSSSLDSGFYTECNSSGNCSSRTGGDRTMWLRNIDKSLPEASNISEGSVPRRQTHISDCSVCEIEGPVAVVHNFNKADNRTTPPACPAGYHRLYEGRSIAAFSGMGRGNVQGYSVSHDPSSIASCYPYNSETVEFPEELPADERDLKVATHSRMPFLESYAQSQTFGHLSVAQHTLYFGRTIPSPRYRQVPFKCSVCWLPPAANENSFSTSAGL